MTVPLGDLPRVHARLDAVPGASDVDEDDRLLRERVHEQGHPLGRACGTLSASVETDALDDIVTDYELPAEMSGTGEIIDGTVHIHAVMAVEGDRSLGGHLHSATVGTFFARAYVLPA